MHFEVLGCAGAAPLQGACSSYLVRGSAATVLLDCGPGTLERLHRRSLLPEIDAIVISHMHADHMLDLLPLSNAFTLSHRGDGKPPLRLLVPAGDGPRVLDGLATTFGSPERFTKAFAIDTYTSTTTPAFGDLSLRFAPTAHPGRCFAARITDGRATVVYGADGSPSAAVEVLATDADLLVLEATFPTDPTAAAHGHMTALEAGHLATTASALRLLLTHHLAGTREDDLIEAASRTFSGPTRLAHERYRIDL